MARASRLRSVLRIAQRQEETAQRDAAVAAQAAFPALCDEKCQLRPARVGLLRRAAAKQHRGSPVANRELAQRHGQPHSKKRGQRRRCLRRRRHLPVDYHTRDFIRFLSSSIFVHKDYKPHRNNAFIESCLPNFLF